MTLYWFLFLLPAFRALARPNAIHCSPNILFSKWIVVIILITFIVGLRHEVGGDWGNYLPLIDIASSKSLSEISQSPDPAYAFFNWLGANLGGGIYTVNLLCGLIFSYGLVAFAKDLPRPSLCIAVSAPYLILVVAMGYSRQGVAIGLGMLGLSFLQRGSLWKFVLTICFATLFHKSAIALLLFALTAKSKNKIFTIFCIICIGAGLYLLLVVEAVDSLKTGYIDQEYESSGAGIRVAMNALPAFIFLRYRKNFILNLYQLRLWTVISFTAVFFIGALFLSPSSTAVDRVALYLIPLQLFVWSHFPDALGNHGKSNTAYVMLVLLYYSFVLFVWLNFADNSLYWLPYKWYPFELLK